MENMKSLDSQFWAGKKVMITGHTGFKGTWLCELLLLLGARVVGYALKPEVPSLYLLADVESRITSYYGDIRDFQLLRDVFQKEEPEIVFHMAAQPLVRESYSNPQYTYETNVMGTVNVCECVRISESVESFVNVTTDKVYLNREWEWGYRENEALDGYDPYSNSKSCSELITHSYVRSFYDKMNISTSTARAGNVIGGGDFAADRIIPDCVRAQISKEQIVLRNPSSIRPYQHVLDPLFAYLLIAEKQYKDKSFSGSYNVGPDEVDCIKTDDLVNLFCEYWSDGASWIAKKNDGPHEATFLKLDCSKMKFKFGWRPKWDIRKAIEKTVEWSKIYVSNGDINECMLRQIKEFLFE